VLTHGCLLRCYLYTALAELGIGGSASNGNANGDNGSNQTPDKQKLQQEEGAMDIDDDTDLTSELAALASNTPTTPGDDLYGTLKNLQRQLEFVAIQEGYIKDETRSLRRELIRAREEVKRIQSVPLVIGQLTEMIDSNHGIVSSTTGQTYYVRVLSTLNREELKTNASVALHRYSNAVVAILPPEADSAITAMQMTEKPDVTYSDIGGMDIQKQEIREAVELPLTHFDLYRQIGIDPPRGVLMWGPPGTGKTMMAKVRVSEERWRATAPTPALAGVLTLYILPFLFPALQAVAHHTSAAFLRVVGSEFVQKYLGEGPRMVRDVFRLAREQSPAIIFIDEVDAIATKRFDAQTGADREVQRILMELLTQMDGFDQTTNVKVEAFPACLASPRLLSIVLTRSCWRRCLER
jgi:26S proteasome regulatory subunit T3